MKVWMVIKVYQTGKRELHEAYFSEERARYSASLLVGTLDYMTVTLETVKVMDDPNEAGTQRYLKPA
jgi:hypothetical protein